jgi:hypothetical protein
MYVINPYVYLIILFVDHIICLVLLSWESFFIRKHIGRDDVKILQIVLNYLRLVKEYSFSITFFLVWRCLNWVDVNLLSCFANRAVHFLLDIRVDLLAHGVGIAIIFIELSVFILQVVFGETICIWI